MKQPVLYRGIFIAIGVIILGIVLYAIQQLTPRNAVVISTVSDATPATQSMQVWIHLAGAVNQPGVYCVSPNERLLTILKANGGWRPDANLDRINLAGRIHDGQRIYIPVKPTLPSHAPPATAIPRKNLAPANLPKTPPSKININLAVPEDLKIIPGIGPILADRIFTYRQKNGPFHSLTDIQHVSGIGEKKFSKISPLLTL